jgi:sec-independent protein translocase protein TatA
MELAFVSAPDLAIIFIIALLVFGPKRLPEVGRQLGSMVRELRKVTGEFTDVFHDARDDFRQVVTISDPPARALDQKYEEGLMDRSIKLAGPDEDVEPVEKHSGMTVSTVPESRGAAGTHHSPSEGEGL